jgi:predicted protein tyrosine phosphatase
MNLWVYSRGAIERVGVYDQPHLLISVTTPGDATARLPTGPATLGVVRLAFPDLDAPAHGFDEAALFGPAQADAIWEAVVRLRPQLAAILVHCDAGLSRSPGIAAALSRALTGDDAAWFARYRPNRRVYRHLLEAWETRWK